MNDIIPALITITIINVLILLFFNYLNNSNVVCLVLNQ